MLHRVVRRGIAWIVIAGVVAFGAGTGRADSDEMEAEASRLGEALSRWRVIDGEHVAGEDNPCRDHVRHLTEAKAPASITFVLDGDTPDLKAGRHPWTDGRAACEHLVTTASHQSQVRASAWSIFEECKRHLTMSNGQPNLDGFGRGKGNYDLALARGIPPTEVIKDKVDGETGTLQGMYEKYCVPGLATQQAAGEARAAPYKKLLKNDKLRIALDDADFVLLAGGGKATPERLASTNVWFEDASPGKTCPNGAQVHVVRRYQFNAQQKLAKVTSHDYCGRPPASAFH